MNDYGTRHTDMRCMMSVWEFEQAYGRKPKMSGSLDCIQAEAWRAEGYELMECNCIGDEIPSWIVTRHPGRHGGEVLDSDNRPIEENQDFGYAKE